ncbi:MAG: hypothetical protein ACREMV_11870 [Gemmatimonadales bacterium]
MKIQYCWRCDAEVPMLDEAEYAELWEAYEACLRDVESYRERRNAALREAPLAELYRPVHEVYERITGVVGIDPRHMLTHRLAAFGPPCAHCGRPLRTPTATLCASCGRPRAA